MKFSLTPNELTRDVYKRQTVRRFIPKGKSIDAYSAEDILFFSVTINGLPRKILNYHTPEEDVYKRQLCMRKTAM